MPSPSFAGRFWLGRCVMGISKEGRARLRTTWSNMLMRCYDDRVKSAGLYKENHINVCKEWVDSYWAFERWALNNGYDEYAKPFECTLDRINPFGNYSPENCRWVSAEQQAQNRKPDYIINMSDDFIGTSEASEYLGLSRSAVASKVKQGQIPAMKIGDSYVYSKTVLSIMFDSIRLKSNRVHRVWTAEEDEAILNPESKNIDALSMRLGRTRSQIYSRLYRLGTSWGAVINRAQ